MKKRMKYLGFFLIVFLCSTIWIGKTWAADILDMGQYQGSSAAPGTGYNAGDCATTFSNGNALCRFKLVPSPNEFGIRISFVYIDSENGRYEQLGRSIDVWKRTPSFSQGIRTTPNTSNSKVNQSPLTFDSFTEVGYSAWIWSGMQYDSASLKQFFLDRDRLNSYAVYMTGHDFTDPWWAQFESEFANENQSRAAKKGVRFFIEPIRAYASKSREFYVMTLSEFARLSIGSPGSIKPYYQNRWNYDGKSKREEWLKTDFLDVGIWNPASFCTTNAPCTAKDIYNINLGHALQIIDFSRFIDTTCDYETGKGFPTADKSASDLTDEEKKCCDDKIAEIKTKYKLGGEYTYTCVLHATSVEENATCLKTYFDHTISQDANYAAAKREFEELSQKYPACWNCDIEKMELIYNKFTDCIMNKPISNLIVSILTGSYDSCFVTYRNDMKEYYDRHPECDENKPNSPYKPDCPYEQCPPTVDKGCDENNYLHFPPHDSSKECCIFFENKMKTELNASGIAQGLKGEALENFVIGQIQAWYNEEGKEFRKECFSGTNPPDDPDDPDYPTSSCRWEDFEITDLDRLANGNCNYSSKVDISDTNNWKCIWESTSISENASDRLKTFKDYYLQYSNPYCGIYCRENVTYDFPDNLLVNAGHHFTVNTQIQAIPNWSPINFTSTRECRAGKSPQSTYKSDGVDQEKFTRDWNNQLYLIRQLYDTWQLEAKKLEYYGLYRRSGTCGGIGSRTPNFTAYPYKIVVNTSSGGSQTIAYGDICGSEGLSRSINYQNYSATVAKYKYYKALQDLEQMKYDIDACTDWSKFDRFAKYYPAIDSAEIQTKFSAIDRSCDQSDDCKHLSLNYSEKADYLNSILSNSTQVYESSTTDVNASRYHKYAEYEDLVEYNQFYPELTIDYQENSYPDYNYHDDLLSKTEGTQTENNFSNSGSYVNKLNCNILNMSGPGSTIKVYSTQCYPGTSLPYSNVSDIHATYTKSIDYKMKDGVFNTIMKPQGIAIHGSEKSDSDQLYIDLGYSALHVHFMTPTGKYPIGLTYPGLTPTNSILGNGFTHNFDKINNTTNNKYQCIYSVSNIIIENDDPDCEGDNCEACKKDACDPETLKGLNLIYRPISLSSPFSGIDGSGRTPGSNWNDSNLINQFITNNRGVNTERLYFDKAPMYQITLTPALIQEVRKYNRTTTYNDFNMDCNSAGRECKSDFIRGTLENGTYNFSTHFNTCTISGNKGTGTCCGVGNWNQCDNADNIRR